VAWEGVFFHHEGHEEHEEEKNWTAIAATATRAARHETMRQLFFDAAINLFKQPEHFY